MKSNFRTTLSGKPAKNPHDIFFIAACVSALAAIVLYAAGFKAFMPPFVIGVPVFLALFVRGRKVLSATAFTLWMIAFVTAPMFYPAFFSSWNGFKLSILVIPLIRFIMFCMGTTLTLGDFKRVLAMPHAVMIGVFLQFAIMPFVGRGVAAVFTSNPDIGAGIVLTGASPGGVASNVIAFLANGNVALSVTMTACSTLLAPFMTPLMTKFLAGAYIHVDFWKMMISILKMVIIPVGGGILFSAFLQRVSAAHAGAKTVSRIIIRILPGLSMFSIAFACSIMTANARDQLLMGGVVFSILGAVIFHNLIGLALGYWGARIFRLKERECRTIAIEVGLQNSGMAAGLALDVFKSELAAAPGVIYSSWHNMTGAILASWWSNHPPKDEET